MPQRSITGFFTSRKGDIALLWEVIYGIMAVSVLMIVFLIFSNYGSFLFGGGPEQIPYVSLRSLASQFKLSPFTDQPFAAVERFPFSLGTQPMTLLGFDAGESKVTTNGIECITPRNKPPQCGTTACLCLFDSTINLAPDNTPAQQFQGLLECKNLPSIATISALHYEQQRGTAGPAGRIGYISTLSLTNLGDTRTVKPLIKHLPIHLQATDTLIIMNGKQQVCTGSPPLFTSYTNEPLYLESVVIDGKRHATITPASPLTEERYAKIYPLLGITIATLERKIAAGALTGAIKDTTSWLSAHEPSHAETPHILYLQGQAFEKASTHDPKTALTILEQLSIRPPLPDLSHKHAGVLALRSYKEAASWNAGATSPDLRDAIIQSGLTLSERLKGYIAEVDTELHPYFAQQARTITGNTMAAAYLDARQSALDQSPLAASKLSAFIASYPASDESKEARYLLAKIHEDHGAITDAITTYQDIVRLFPQPEHQFSDGSIKSASLEIQRICRQHLTTSDIWETCSRIDPSITCPQPDLVLLPKHLCTPTLITSGRCTAHPLVADAFLTAQDHAKRAGTSLEITGAYQPVREQHQQYQLYTQGKGLPTRTPSCREPHVAGKAIDVRLKNQDMGSEPPPDMSNPNRQQLEAIMCTAGFTRWNQAYWQYTLTEQASPPTTSKPACASA